MDVDNVYLNCGFPISQLARAGPDAVKTYVLLGVPSLRELRILGGIDDVGVRYVEVIGTPKRFYWGTLGVKSGDRLGEGMYIYLRGRFRPRGSRSSLRETRLRLLL